MSKRLRAALRRGDEDEIRYSIEEELRHEGYLRQEPLTKKSLAAAVARFQRDHGLRDHGSLDDDTLAMLQMPLCGNALRRRKLGPLAAAAPVWPRRDLTFARTNGCPTLTENEEREATSAAFAAWEAVSTLRFAEASPADIDVGWFFGEHDAETGFAFDGRGGTFAHAFDVSSTIHPGELHLDAAETWTVGVFTAGNADLMTVVLHEIGHVLGIVDHLPQFDAVMFRRFPPDRAKRTLTQRHRRSVSVTSARRRVEDRRFASSAGCKAWPRIATCSSPRPRASLPGRATMRKTSGVIAMQRWWRV